MLKLSRSDLVLTVLGVVGLAVVVSLYQSAFPLALVEMQVTREEAVAKATEFVEGLGAELSDFRHAAIFSGESEALIFLQRTVGDDEAGRWAREEVPIWLWNVRWFKPLETEEWLAEVGVDGELVGFRHIVEEAAPGADLDESTARSIAEAFLGEHEWNLSQLEAVSSSADRKDNRTDHLFVWKVSGTDIVWKEDGSDVGTGYSRVSIRVLGDEIGGYVRTVRVPEQFSRELQRTLSVGQFLALGAIGLMIAMAVAAGFIAIRRFRTDAIDWRLSVVFAGVVTVAFWAAMATTWPMFAFAYQTQISFPVYVGVGAIGLLVLGLLIYFVPIVFCAAAGESMARDHFPDSVRGLAATARGKLFSREFSAAALRGYALAAALLGFLTGFYWFAQRYMGAWLPAEGPYSEIFNNLFPFLTPLTISLVAAISEETIYRLFGISLFKKLSGSTTVALIVPAAIWAFGHSTYPVFPVYIRGIELTIAGVLFGIAFLHYGLVTCIVAHYVIDAVALGIPLVTSGNSTYLISGLAIIGLALVPGVVGFFAGRRRSGPTAATHI